MWGVGGMQVHRIRGRRLVYREVVETLSNYKKSYFWRYGNPICGDATRCNRIENDQARVLSRPAWGTRGEGAVWFSVCGALSDDWANGGYVDVLFPWVWFQFFWELVLFWGVGTGLSDKKYLSLFLVSKTSAGWDSRNLILAIDGCRIVRLAT